MFLDNVINWTKVNKRLHNLLKDESKLDELINEELIETIKQYHPDDYMEYLDKRKKEFDKLKDEFKEKYKKEMENRIKSFLSSSLTK